MRKLMMAALCALFATFAVWAASEDVDGITWTYWIDGDEAKVKGDGGAAIPTTTAGAIVIPSTLGGKSVTSIG